ncbi:MAG: phenylacetate--CoA ligase [Chloroflexi bacterium]|nr:phenylacetate--CoA ligase [Chloroflexota bacterium]
MSERRYWDERMETMSRDELAHLQNHRLQWQVQRCYEGSAFYRERLDRMGVQPGDIQSLEDVRKLPVVTKQELRDEQQAHPPFGRYVVAPPQNLRELHPSTGTTGVPVNTLWSEADVANITSFTARTLWQFGTRPGDIVQNAFSYGLWVAGLSVHYGAAKIGCLVLPIGAGLTNRQVDYLQSPGATVLIATPSYALYLAEALRERGVEPASIPLRLGCFGGEAGAENASTRRKIEAGLGIAAFDYYGLAEIAPTFASECPAQAGIHWAEDHVLVEVLDPETKQPVPEGEVGVLVFTHLTRQATPMLRYWSNDYARLTTEPCECGRTHLRSPGGILGRHDDLVVYRGAKFYPVQVEKVVRSFPELSDEFRIELALDPRLGSELVTVVAERLTDPDPSLHDRLTRALREELLVTPQVRLEPFGTLERTAFKAKRILDLRGEAR